MVISDVVPWCMHDKVAEVGADESQKLLYTIFLEAT